VQSTAELPTPNRTAHGRSLDRAWVVSLCVLCPIGLLIATWTLTGFGGSNAARFVAWFGAVVGLAVVTIAGVVADRWPAKWRFTWVVIAALLIVGTTFATATGRMASEKIRADASSWQASLNAAHLNIGVQCLKLRAGQLTLQYFGPVTEVCPTNATSLYRPSLDFLGTTPEETLVYYPHPGQAPGEDVCIAHVTGPWWQTVPFTTGDVACPAGFTFLGGG
jgi:hypothetical protein